jgi:uncharacterized membrane protein (DUF106 family)
MSIVNGILRAVFDALLAPFRGFHPLVGLVVLSVPISVIMLLLFKKTSNQKRMAAIKSQIHAGLFEIRLFNDDLRAIFKAQGEILAQNLKYLGHTLVPLVFMVIVFVPILGQLQFNYGYQGLAPGEKTLVKVKLDENWMDRGVSSNSGRPDVRLETPGGLKVETPAVWIPSQHEISWRVAAEKWGDYELAVKAGGESYTKSLRVADDVSRRSLSRVAPGFVGELLNPAEPPLPKDSPLASISVTYPEAGPMFFDLSMWVWVFFGLTIVVAFGLRKPLGVTI